jgi:hypothetical protein
VSIPSGMEAAAQGDTSVGWGVKDRALEPWEDRAQASWGYRAQASLQGAGRGLCIVAAAGTSFLG